ncbi:hypothetical protein BH10ACT5_BH10ACT5_09250 [soil metagenome]
MTETPANPNGCIGIRSAFGKNQPRACRAGVCNRGGREHQVPLMLAERPAARSSSVTKSAKKAGSISIP